MKVGRCFFFIFAQNLRTAGKHSQGFWHSRCKRCSVTVNIESFRTVLQWRKGGRSDCHTFLHYRSWRGQLTFAFWSRNQISCAFSSGEIKPLYSKHRVDRRTLLITGLLFDTQKPIKSQSKTRVMITKAYGVWAEVVLVQKIMWFVLAMLCQV